MGPGSPLRYIGPIAQISEQTADQPPGQRVNDYPAEACAALQPRRAVEGLPDRGLLPALAGVDPITDDDQPRRDADPYPQRLARDRLCRDRLPRPQGRRGCACSALTSRRARPPEVDQHAIARGIAHKSLEPTVSSPQPGADRRG